MTSLVMLQALLNDILLKKKDKKQTLVIKILLSIVKHGQPSYTPIPNNIKQLTFY